MGWSEYSRRLKEGIVHSSMSIRDGAERFSCAPSGGKSYCHAPAVLIVAEQPSSRDAISWLGMRHKISFRAAEQRGRVWRWPRMLDYLRERRLPDWVMVPVVGIAVIMRTPSHGPNCPEQVVQWNVDDRLTIIHNFSQDAG
jgi:hypothetical protein